MNIKALFDEMGVRAFRELIKSFGARRWYSLCKELKDLAFTFGNDISQNIENIITEGNKLICFSESKV